MTAQNPNASSTNQCLIRVSSVASSPSDKRTHTRILQHPPANGATLAPTPNSVTTYPNKTCTHTQLPTVFRITQHALQNPTPLTHPPRSPSQQQPTTILSVFRALRGSISPLSAFPVPLSPPPKKVAQVFNSSLDFQCQSHILTYTCSIAWYAHHTTQDL